MLGFRRFNQREVIRLAVIVLAIPALLSCAARPSNNLLQEMAIITGAPWLVQGKIGCRLEGKGGQARFEWRQEAVGFRASFQGPFGTARHNLQSDGKTLNVRYPDASEANFLVHQPVTLPDLGVTLPIAAFSWWLRGLPDPGAERKGMPADFMQHGWRIVRNIPTKKRTRGLVLPSKLEISQSKIFCRIRLSKWQTIGV